MRDSALEVVFLFFYELLFLRAEVHVVVREEEGAARRPLTLNKNGVHVRKEIDHIDSWHRGRTESVVLNDQRVGNGTREIW